MQTISTGAGLPGLRGKPRNDNGATWLGSLAGHLHGLYSSWLQRRRDHRDARALDEMTDRELQDMGLDRGSIPAVMNGTYWRD